MMSKVVLKMDPEQYNRCVAIHQSGKWIGCPVFGMVVSDDDPCDVCFHYKSNHLPCPFSEE